MKTAKRLNKKPLAVGYIPAGTGNDFARGYGISMHPQRALNQILTADAPQKIMRRFGVKKVIFLII